MKDPKITQGVSLSNWGWRMVAKFNFWAVFKLPRKFRWIFYQNLQLQDEASTVSRTTSVHPSETTRGSLKLEFGESKESHKSDKLYHTDSRTEFKEEKNSSDSFVRQTWGRAAIISNYVFTQLKYHAKMSHKILSRKTALRCYSDDHACAKGKCCWWPQS